MSKHGGRTKPWCGVRNYGVRILITSLILVFLVLFIFLRDADKKPGSALGLPHKKWNSFDSLVQFNPTVEFRNGTDVIWQIPNSPKAVLFIAHGCNCRAAYFWDRSPTCLNCVGLPEERLLVLEALARRFAVLTISSMGRCWTMAEERIIVRDTIRWWTASNKLENLPLVALGASSGGHFVSALARNLRFSSIALMIAEGMFDQMDIPARYPPTLFVHMPKDTYRQHKISQYMEVLKAKGIDAAEVECTEFPLSPNIFADRIPGVDQSVSSKLFELFRKEGFIDENGYMKTDGRRTHWKKAVSKDKTLILDKQLFQHVQEELNLAFAYHEMTSLQSDHIFKWFESHIS
ncbi:uncharacterized protein LOC116193500 [Punica granatum]|uniref:Uncharacterized protein LOC116193500 n=1 Tax=Punica granatum TaxID=22663 RepID=A0A6P8C3J2_PUNGR|nr:uncharacterized protein LOC116193500 [Punica granatum]